MCDPSATDVLRRIRGHATAAGWPISRPTNAAVSGFQWLFSFRRLARGEIELQEARRRLDEAVREKPRVAIVALEE